MPEQMFCRVEQAFARAEQAFVCDYIHDCKAFRNVTPYISFCITAPKSGGGALAIH